jgi:hypothetical protein
MDLGVLAEALIFYDEVRFVANRILLEALFRTVGPETLVALTEEGFLSLAYEADEFGIQTVGAGTPHEVTNPSTSTCLMRNFPNCWQRF